MASSREFDRSREHPPESGVRHPLPELRPERGPHAASGTAVPAWLGWAAALGLFAAIVLLVLGTLLELTHELLDLGQQRPLVRQER